MNRSSFLWAAALLTAACGGGTELESSTLAFSADVLVTSDPGHGVLGVGLLQNGNSVATTNEEGRAHVSLRGNEGDTVNLTVQCPSGFQSPKESIVVSLRPLSSGSRAPSFTAQCAPLTRTVVVGIRAENGPNLPVTYLGKEVARTDGSGAAHVVLNVKANDPVTLGLDTKSNEGRPRLRPENPTLTFVPKDRDDVVTLDQKFDVERLPSKPRNAPVRTGPTRI